MPSRHNDTMLTALVCLVVGPTWTAVASDDVWVYPHASTPGGEPFLRVWGSGSRAVDSAIPPGDEYSYGYVQFALKGAPAGELASAELIVWNVPNETLSKAVLKEYPLEVFGLKGSFKEDTFSFNDGSVGPVEPGFGKAEASIEKDGIKLTVNLLDEKGNFKKMWSSARDKGSIGFALASMLSPTESRSMIYKVNSKEGPEATRPTLKLSFKEE